MEFVPVDPALVRRSTCGRWLIEKTIIDGKPHYVLWEYYRTQYGFGKASDAIDEATTLEDQAVAAWKARPAHLLTPLEARAAGATPGSESDSAAP